MNVIFQKAMKGNDELKTGKKGKKEREGQEEGKGGRETEASEVNS